VQHSVAQVQRTFGSLCVCLCIRVCVYIYIYMCVCVCVCVCMYMYICMNMCMHEVDSEMFLTGAAISAKNKL